jgi:hypothetical protein
MADRQAFMSQLRDMTYALGEGVADPPKSKVKRPLRAPKEARRARKTPA